MNELTPNVRHLLILRIGNEAIPAGGGLPDGMEFFTDADKRKRVMESSEKWVREAIALVRSAAEPNPWRTASDEDIATELVRLLK